MSDALNDSPGSNKAAASPRGLPFSAMGLMIILTLVFLLEPPGCDGTFGNPQPRQLLAMGALSPKLVHSGEWYRLFTSAFLQWNWSQLVMNCLALLLLSVLEIVIGSAWFMAIFLISALGGSLCSAFLYLSDVVSVGASGAVAGMFGALVVANRLRRLSPLQQLDRSWRRILLSISTPIAMFALLVVFSDAAIGALDPVSLVGGGLTGAVVMALLICFWPADQPRPPLPALAWVLSGLCLAVVAYNIGTSLKPGACPPQATLQNPAQALPTGLHPDTFLQVEL